METKVNVSIKVVDDLKIRTRKPNQLLGVCPVCYCRDANFHTGKMVWHCWHCGLSGRIISDDPTYVVEEEKTPALDIPEIRKLYTNLARKYHDSLSTAAKDYLKRRGLTDETINKFQLGFCSTDFYDDYANHIAEDSGVLYQNYPLLSNRIVIPYIVGEEVTDLRGRILDSVFQYKEGTPTYTSLAGSHDARGATFLFNHDVIAKEGTVIVTEGEFKAILAVQYGFPVVATPGIFGWNKVWSPLFKDKNVVLAADNDTISGTRSPAYLMAKSLLREIPQLRVATMYRTNAKQKKVDVDSMILESGVQSFRNAIEGASPADEWLQLEEKKGHGKRK